MITHCTQAGLSLAKPAFVIIYALALAGCASTAPYPPKADIQMLVEPKPRPPVAILTDPAASDRYNSAIEAYADRLSSAGKRLCRYFAATGMDVECAP